MLFGKAHFNQKIDRSNPQSRKWNKYSDTDILPFWIADMDFASPSFILEAIQSRLEHPVMGYSDHEALLNSSFCRWLKVHHDWEIHSEWVIWIPGVVPGLNISALLLNKVASIMVPTPVYPPFLEIGGNAGLDCINTPMKKAGLIWTFDFIQMEKDIRPETKMLFLCNPQNPTGRVFTMSELSELADFVKTHNLLLVSDEIHCNIILNEQKRHLPIALHFPEIADQTISLYSAAKTYNIPGMRCAAAVIPNPELRERFKRTMRGIIPSVGPLESIASIAAFSDETNWIPALNEYLAENASILASSLGTRSQIPEATYLAWIDISDLKLTNPEAYLDSFGLGISPGELFGKNGYIRFNFACPREQLLSGLDRLNKALTSTRR